MKAGSRVTPFRTIIMTTALLALASLQIWVVLGALRGDTASALFDDIPGGALLLLLSQCLAVTVPLIACWRLALALAYRPVPSASDAELPELTVIVPAYNEGRQVYATLQSLIASRYPLAKLRIIAVNDGSVDDTWSWMRRAADEWPDRIIALNCRINRGKRAALYEGFNRAYGDVIVTVDSDSEVLPDTLRNLVSPMVRDANVGAVAGNVRVLNRDAGPIPSMLDVSFTYSFEFIRAGESVLDTVMCCPGALSAYRRSAVEVCKDAWLEQTFLGQHANIGEDRALTNAILRQGYLSRFQSNAVVLTEVPNHTRQLSKMFLRWARSNVRETLALAGFVFTRFRRSSALGARFNATLALLRLGFAPVAFGAAVLSVASNPALVPWMIALSLVASLPRAVLYGFWREATRALWAFPYSVYYLFCLSWIAPYAFFTPGRSAWLTRVKALDTAAIAPRETTAPRGFARGLRPASFDSVVKP